MHEVYVQLTLDGALREYNKRSSGCVLRAVQSLLGAKATEKQWDERLAQVAAFSVPMDLINKKRHPVDFEEELRWEKLRERDIGDITLFLGGLEASDTPLGESIRRFDWCSRIMGVEEMKRSLLKGSRVLLLTVNHLAHIMYDKETNWLYSKSDRYLSPRIDRGALYRVYEFTQKPMSV